MFLITYASTIYLFISSTFCFAENLSYSDIHIINDNDWLSRK